MTVIDKVLSIAAAEVGYLEKKSNSNLDSATNNAGSNNYTKYWRDVKPSYQGQPWCAAFVTWCFEKAFGKSNATKLLKHYPYVYCPTMASLFTLYSTPKRGDIVIFKRGGTYAHTGIVESVSGNSITTIEGNTSGGSTIIANGGGVCRKTYLLANLPGTKFCRPNYESIESEELTMSQYEELKELISNLTEENTKLKKQVDELRMQNGYYNYIDDNMNANYRPTIQRLVNEGIIKGNEKGELKLTNDMMRSIVFCDRMINR